MKQGTQADKKLASTSAIVFGPTIALLFVVNLLNGSSYWFQRVLLARGIGLFFHWSFVLGPGAGKETR